MFQNKADPKGSAFFMKSNWRTATQRYDEDVTNRKPQLRALVNPRCIEVIDRGSAEIIKKMPGARRVALAFQMGDMARRMMAASIRQTYPEWDEAQVQAEVANRVRRGSSR
jgi:hypothetical protein